MIIALSIIIGIQTGVILILTHSIMKLNDQFDHALRIFFDHLFEDYASKNPDIKNKNISTEHPMMYDSYSESDHSPEMK